MGHFSLLNERNCKIHYEQAGDGMSRRPLKAQKYFEGVFFWKKSQSHGAERAFVSLEIQKPKFFPVSSQETSKNQSENHFATLIF